MKGARAMGLIVAAIITFILINSRSVDWALIGVLMVTLVGVLVCDEMIARRER